MESRDLNLAFPSASPSDLQRRQVAAGGLLRYRSAPSSLLGEVCDDFLPATRPTSPDSLLARFLSSDFRPPVPPNPPAPPPPAASAPMEHAGVGGAMFYGSQGGVESCSNLVRQSSSPAGFFSHASVDNGYRVMRNMGGLRNGNGAMGEAGIHQSRLNRQISFSSRQSSLMSQISEIGSEDGPEESNLANGNGGSRCYLPGYPIASWDDSPMLPESMSGVKRAREADGAMISGPNQSEHQDGDVRNHVSGLTHQLSLPKNSSVMSAMEKFLQFQDAVPCKIRAKRGCATHPRSIAERVRRTRISERMRKLQELVPNMDKQTNTADMLDLAVEYIKDLQKQVKMLSDDRASCKCVSSN